MKTSTDNPHISVCIPVYKTEPYLAQCLASVFKQDYDSFEIVIVNDASTGRGSRGWKAKKIIRHAHKEGNSWRRKKGLDPAKEENFAMKAGHYLEDAVAQFWHDETGQEIIKRSAGDWLIRDDERPYLQVSPDRTYWLSGQPRNAQNKGILECKTTQLSIDGDDIPKHWFCQVQYQLGVACLTQGSLAWLCSGREFGYKNLAFVPDFYMWLVEEVDKFWKDNIIGNVEPEATDVQDVLLKFNRHTDGKIIEVSDELFAACQELKDVKKEIDALSAYHD